MPKRVRRKTSHDRRRIDRLLHGGGHICRIATLASVSPPPPFPPTRPLTSVNLGTLGARKCTSARTRHLKPRSRPHYSILMTCISCREAFYQSLLFLEADWDHGLYPDGRETETMSRHETRTQSQHHPRMGLGHARHGKDGIPFLSPRRHRFKQDTTQWNSHLARKEKK